MDKPIANNRNDITPIIFREVFIIKVQKEYKIKNTISYIEFIDFFKNFRISG